MTMFGREPAPLLERTLVGGDGPDVVAVGGGTGLAQALRAIRSYAGGITAVVSVADDGGSSGRLAPALDMPPPGDIRRCLLALTPDESIWQDLFDYRFPLGDVEGHSLGNLVLAALTAREGDVQAALRVAERLLGTVGSVVAVSSDRLSLEATVDGSAVSGQAAIAAGRGIISDLRVLPDTAVASDDAIEAIARADQIVLGPGSLFTSVLATLIVPGVVDAINDADAQLVFVLNLTTQDGETLAMDAGDHVEALLKLSGIRCPNVVVAQDPPVFVEPPLRSLVADEEVLFTYGVDLITADLVDLDAPVSTHHPGQLGRVLGRLHS